MCVCAGLTPALAMDAFTKKAERRVAKLQRTQKRTLGQASGAVVTLDKVLHMSCFELDSVLADVTV